VAIISEIWNRIKKGLSEAAGKINRKRTKAAKKQLL